MMIELSVVEKRGLIFYFTWRQAMMAVRFMNLPLNVSSELPASQACAFIGIFPNCSLQVFDKFLITRPVNRYIQLFIQQILKQLLWPLYFVRSHSFDRCM